VVILTDYEGAIKKPFSDIKSLVIGCLLNIIPIINFFSIGYSVEVSRLSMKGKNKMPEWTNWGALFVDGLLVFLISLIWMIPVIILLLATIGFSVITAIMKGGLEQGLLPILATAGTGLLITLIVAILIGYFSPLAVMGFVKSKNFGDAFDFSTIFKKAFTSKYFGVWIVIGIISFVLGFIGGIIPFVSLVLGPALGFISWIIAFTLLGEIYNKI